MIRPSSVGGQGKAKGHTLIGIRRHRELATVPLDNGTTNGQPHAHALGLGREEGRKHLLQRAYREAATPIANSDLDPGRFEDGGPNAELAGRNRYATHRL